MCIRRETREKARQSLAFPPVSKPHITYYLYASTVHKYCIYLESRRCRYRSIIFVCFYLHVSVVNLIDYSNIDKMKNANNEIEIIK